MPWRQVSVRLVFEALSAVFLLLMTNKLNLFVIYEAAVFLSYKWIISRI
jgi:hypothetical protein